MAERRACHGAARLLSTRSRPQARGLHDAGWLGHCGRPEPGLGPRSGHAHADTLRNRFVHLDFEVDIQEWSEWAIQAAIRPEVIAFLRFRPELLSQFDRDANAFPSPRVLGICIAHSQHGR